MEDSMIDMPNLAFDGKVGNKRVRNSEKDTEIGRLEKRPSGILGVNVVECGETGGAGAGAGAGAGGIINTFISNVFHKKESGIEEEEVKNDVFDVKVEDPNKIIGVDGGSEGGEGGGIINTFFSNIFQNTGSENNDCEKPKSDLVNEVVEKPEVLDGGRKCEVEDVSAKIPYLPSKNLEGQKLKMKPDEYSERVFFLNNNRR